MTVDTQTVQNIYYLDATHDCVIMLSFIEIVGMDSIAVKLLAKKNTK